MGEGTIVANMKLGCGAMKSIANGALCIIMNVRFCGISVTTGFYVKEFLFVLTFVLILSSIIIAKLIL